MEKLSSYDNGQTSMEVAVIGMAGRFPGAKNIDEFWENLKNGLESIHFFSDEELKEAGISDKMINNPRFVRTWGGTLDDIESFDAHFFNYTPREAELLNPQVRFFHECAWEGLEDAGYNPETYKGLIGIFGGATPNFNWSALSLSSGKTAELGSYESSLLTLRDYLCTRTAYKINLKGPAVFTYAACATALLAIHLAFQALSNGECDMALAGGVSLATHKTSGYIYEEGMILSPDGHCRAFDADAKGTIVGEGGGIVVLKPLENAINEGDHIYTLIMGTAMNNDGKRKGTFTAPSREAQTEVISMAQQFAEVNPQSISYIEAHGTGTPLGDPIEIEALKQAFNTEKKGFCGIGSVKTNVGHLDAAAGIAGFIKTVMAMKHRLLPPNLHYKRPNPKIDFENSPFYIVNQLKEWKNEKYPLRAGVSSFGFGGANVHVVLEEWPDGLSSNAGGMAQSAECLEHGSWGQGRGGVSPPNQSREYQLILLSAKTQSTLDKVTENLLQFLKDNPRINFAAMVYTLQVGRRAFNHRKMLICSTVAEVIETLSSLDSQKVQTFYSKIENPPVIMMFPGQGSQYINMGWDLYRTQPIFREEMDRCFEILNTLVDYNLKEILYPGRGKVSSPTGEPPATCNLHLSPSINQTEIAQPLLFAFEYALAKLLMQWGIRPYAMIGHSIGEYVAAHLSGVFSLEDALRIVALRGKLMQQLPSGAMLSVSLSEKELKPFLLESEEISLAAVNGPSLCVVSGPGDKTTAFENKLKQKGYENRRLHTSHAFHSHMMDPIIQQFEHAVKQIQLNKPQIPYISNLTGKWTALSEATDPYYWAKHLRKTVRFAEGLDELVKIDNALFLEVGPGKALSTFARQHNHKKEEQMVLNLIRHPKEALTDDYYLLNKIGQLWLYGVNVDWDEFHAGEKKYRMPLPTYPFVRQRFWLENNSPALNTPKTPAPSFEKKADIGKWFYIPSWKRTLKPTGKIPGKSEASHKWLVFANEVELCSLLVSRLESKDHHISIVEPGASFGELAEGRYQINPLEAENYDLLLKALNKADQVPNRILHLWSVTKNSKNGKDPLKEVLRQIQNHRDYRDPGFYSLFYLTQCLGRQSINHPIEITVLTNNLQDVTGEEELCPLGATVQGLVGTIPREYHNIACRWIDILLPLSNHKKRKRLLDHLTTELNANRDIDEEDRFRDPVIAYRGNHRLKPSFEAVRLEKSPNSNHLLREKGVYLITGGLGGIGLVLARYLARTVKARLILTGRSSLPERDQWDKWLAAHPRGDELSERIRQIRELEALGAEVMVLKGDAADYDGMREIVTLSQERLGKINGIIHAAGVPGDGVIQLKRPEVAEKVLSPKVKGTLVLEAIFKDHHLDFWLLCSSIAAVLPRFGQVDYCSANAFLDAFANYKSRQGNCDLTISINWDAWQEVGMAADAIKKDLSKLTAKNTRTDELNHHLYQKRIREGSQQVTYVAYFSAQKTWFLDEHRIMGKPLLPGTVYLEMACSAFQLERSSSSDTNDIDGTVELSDVYFTTPLVMEEDEEREMHTILTPQDSRFHFSVVSLQHSDEDRWEKHAAGIISLVGKKEAQLPENYDIKKIESLCRQEIKVYENHESQPHSAGVFTLGPHWSNIQKVKYGINRAISYHQLPQRFSSEVALYKLHPSLMDLAVNRMTQKAVLPFFCKKVVIKKPLTSRILSYTRDVVTQQQQEEVLTYNISIMDGQGTELVTIREYTLRKVGVESPTSRQFIQRLRPLQASASSPKTLDVKEPLPENFLRHGILPAEGVEVFNRILLAQAPQVIVSTIDFPARIQDNRTISEITGEESPAPKDIQPPSSTRQRPELSTPYTAPNTKIEEELVVLWQRMLGIAPVGIYDDFFELGGDSLKAVTLRGRIKKELKVDVPLSEFFTRPTLKQLGEYIEATAEKSEFYSIKPVEEKEYYELSSAQKRIYLVQQLDPRNTSYNLPQVFVLEGDFQHQQMQEAFRRVIRRNESLRTSFQVVNHEPVQQVHPYPDFNLQYIDLTMDSTGYTNENDIIKDFVKPFGLSKLPLIRVILVKTRENRQVLAIDTHHIVVDATSMRLLIKEVMDFYVGKTLTGLKIRYRDYSQWQNIEKKKETMKQQEAFWLKQFAGEIPLLNLPTDFPRDIIHGFEGKSIVLEIDKEQTEALSRLALDQGATLFMTLLAIFNIFLAKLSGQEDIIVGIPTAGREHEDFAPLIGMFVNTLALRNYPSSERTFMEFMQDVRERTADAFENQAFQFDDLVDRLQVRRDTSRNPLFDAMFALQNLDSESAEVPEQQMSGISLKPYQYQNKTAKFDLSLMSVKKSGILSITFEYSNRLFKDTTMRRYMNYFKRIVALVLKDPDQELGKLEIIPGKEKKQILYDFNDTGVHYSNEKLLHQLFEEQMQRTPDHIALSGDSEKLQLPNPRPQPHLHHQEEKVNYISITYKELNKKSHRLAHLLKLKGVQPDAIIGLLVDRTVEMLIGIMGILKAGGAYLPIEPTFPPDRQEYILGDIGTKMVVTTRPLVNQYKKNFEILFIDSLKFPGTSPSHVNVSPLPSSLAYVIYTSGSTGSPKGVMIAHQPVVNFIEAICRHIPFTSHDTVLSLTTVSFDIFGLEALLPLVKGSKVVIGTREEQLDTKAASTLIKKEKVTIFQLTPSMLQLFVLHEKAAFSLKILQYLLVGGEAFPEPLLERVRKLTTCKLFNLYGPTETTIWSTLKDLSGEASLDIGAPIANTQIYILDKNRAVQPIKIVGELFIGGDGLARGYINNPELTAEKFDHYFWDYQDYHDEKNKLQINKKFLRGSRGRFLQKEPPGRRRQKIYKTGDLARWLTDGNIECLGRIDHQVKIQGFRIELGEIESSLQSCQKIKEAVVTVMEGKGDDSYKSLCAYIVPENNETKAHDLVVSESREHLLKKLPMYMIPSYFVVLEEIPLTSNGKIDRKALAAVQLKSDTETDNIPPTTRMEKLLAGIWKDVLKIDKPGIHNSFFNLGGNSMGIIRVHNKLKEALQKDISVVLLYRYMTIHTLAQYLTQQEEIEKQLEEEMERSVDIRKGKNRLKKRMKRVGV